MVRTLIQVGIPLIIGKVIGQYFSSDEDVQLFVGFFLVMLTDLIVRYFEAKQYMEHNNLKWMINRFYGMVLPIIPLPVWFFALIALFSLLEIFLYK